jgi:hypothetical protein
MKRLQRQLLQKQATFARTVRRVTLVCTAALALVLVGLIYMQARLQRQSTELAAKGKISPREDLGQPVVITAPREGDPSQLVPPEILYPELHGSPVRKTGAKAAVSLIDQDILFTVLQTLKKVPQEELAARVDKSIKWEDFSDKNRREQIRGRVCRFRGTLRRWEQNKAVDLSPIGLTALYEGQIQDVLGRTYSFYCFEAPAKLPERTEVAEIVGVFYKLIVYTSRGGEQLVTPLIVGRTIIAREGFSPPPPVTARIIESAPPWALWVGAALAVAVIVGLATLLLRRKTSHRRGRRERRGDKQL